jgi:hypothetical protein
MSRAILVYQTNLYGGLYNLLVKLGGSLLAQTANLEPNIDYLTNWKKTSFSGKIEEDTREEKNNARVTETKTISSHEEDVGIPISRTAVPVVSSTPASSPTTSSSLVRDRQVKRLKNSPVKKVVKKKVSAEEMADVKGIDNGQFKRKKRKHNMSDELVIEVRRKQRLLNQKFNPKNLRITRFERMKKNVQQKNKTKKMK